MISSEKIRGAEMEEFSLFCLYRKGNLVINEEERRVGTIFASSDKKALEEVAEKFGGKLIPNVTYKEFPIVMVGGATDTLFDPITIYYLTETEKKVPEKLPRRSFTN